MRAIKEKKIKTVELLLTSPALEGNTDFYKAVNADGVSIMDMAMKQTVLFILM